MYSTEDIKTIRFGQLYDEMRETETENESTDITHDITHDSFNTEDKIY